MGIGASGGRRMGIIKFIFLAGAAILAATPAFSDTDCGGDLQKMSARREAALKNINELVAAAKGKKLDAEQFCVRSRPLNAAEDAMLAYMIKNKDWCQIPDDAVNQLKETHAKSVAFSGKACTVAVQMKKMKDQAEKAAQQGAQQAQEQAQPLPAGPL